ncbi:phosphatidylinositol transfer protein csr1 [Coemansia sp. RSA 1813]|nr:phosphatidylinositol transfer protein csr1 [Coemansia sp. RSA 1646]KAJ1770807.1 phosphatidylinositol transfer protein csr1 [Coemansia sp. RSA 1843]KAJ2091029.1 phosphatidylinositol transfer protein csr1 [Coemansia sp. RSA 986]KAJ2215939.1 phosphatidylinositol transfer protein csr1 [Coemansia sp. RSA 487]KAJ2570216.1 phosphatidylinositol transfer protein csr1 [Coemansia sp. RSA 1813]
MSGLFKAISRQMSHSSDLSSVSAAGSGREAITTQFSKGRVDTCGVYQHLSPEEENLLADFWEKLLDDFDKPLQSVECDPIAHPVDCDDEQERKKARDIEENSPFEVFDGCMYNQSVANRCKELGIVPECGKDGEFVPAFDKSAMDPNKVALGEAFWAAVREDHPDVLVLRFLRARKWDLDKAYRMAVAAVKWRVREGVQEIIWHGDTANDASLMWKGVSYAHGKDKLGHPIIWSGSCLHHQKDQSYPQLKRYLIWMMETLRQLLSPPVERVCLIMDLTDHSNANMDWPFVKTFLKFLEAYYPECLGICIVYNGPWWFSGVWKLISPLLDPVVAAKVQFAQKPEGLLKFIDAKELLEIRGGKDKYVYKYVMPEPNENKLMFDAEARQYAAKKLGVAHEEFIRATIEWTDSKEAGDDDGFAAAATKRIELSDLVVNAARGLDKYTRARHFYHRTGVLSNGVVDWTKVQEADEADTSAAAKFEL